MGETFAFWKPIPVTEVPHRPAENIGLAEGMPKSNRDGTGFFPFQL